MVRNGDLGSLQNEPEYDAAKAGDKEAALNLVDRLFDDTTAEAIRDLIGDARPLVLPVISSEANGNNWIPLTDDTLTMGGTIASLRGYIENRGGHVVGASVMTAHEGALDLAVKPKLLSAIDEKHGRSMNQYWQETFGYGIDELTQGEAGHLRSAASVDAIRKRITTARREGIERLDAY